MTDSSTGGYLGPSVASPPLEDDALDDVFHDAIVGITGLTAAMVRPRYQTVLPKQPDPGTDWASFMVGDETPDAGPSITHNPAGQGTDVMVRHEELAVACTFYGPNSKRYAKLLRDGISIPQNVEGLQAFDIGFVETSAIQNVPELYNQQWIKRSDITLTFRRKVTRTFAVLSLTSAEIDINEVAGPNSPPTTTKVII